MQLAFSRKGGLWETQVPDGLHEWADALPVADDDWNCTQETPLGYPFDVYERPAEPLLPPQPSTHRSGLQFDSELGEMTDAAREVVVPLLGGDAVVTEFPYGGPPWRTDLAICAIDAAAVARRLRIFGHLDPLTTEWRYLKAYRYLDRNAPVTRAEFVEGRSPYVEETSSEVWNWLESRGYLVTNETGYATTLPHPEHIEAHAVELKPRDWETALEQAERATDPYDYSDAHGYAEYRWVCLDAAQIGPALSNRDAFEAAGVGLLGLAPGGAVKLIDAEESSPPDGSRDRHHLNERTLPAEPPEPPEEPADGPSRPAHQAGLAEYS